MGRAREAVRQPLGGPPSLCTMPSDAHTAAGFDLYNGWWVTAVPGSSIGAAQNSTAGEYTRRRPPRPWRRPFGPVRTPRVPVAVRLPVNKASSSPPPTPPPSLPAGGPNWSVRGTGGAPPGRCKKARAAPLATDRWWRTTTRDVDSLEMIVENLHGAETPLSPPPAPLPSAPPARGWGRAVAADDCNGGRFCYLGT